MSNTRHTLVDTDLGRLTLVADGDDLVGVYFPGHHPRPDRAAFGAAVNAATDPTLDGATTQLGEYLAGDRRQFELSLATHGDEFSERVWALLREIPYGTTTTYGRVAEQLGDRALAQRVGQAVGRNPLSIVIPCHRVIGANGSLTGFAGGIDRKRRLLDVEETPEAAAARLF